MELKDLRSFLTVAETLNFTAAAKRLHIAQPPLSLRIRQLEQELGAPLFVRSTRSVRLSAAGKAFREAVAPLLVKLDQAAETCRRAARGETGMIRIGYSGRASQHLLQQLLAACRAHLPGVVLDLAGPHPTGQLRVMLHDDAIDLALCFLPLNDRAIASRKVTLTEFSLVLPANHRLAARSRIQLAQLADEPFVGYPSNQGFHLRQAMDDACRRAGFSPTVVKESSASQLLLCLVAAGTGVSIVPSELEHQEVVPGTVFKKLGANAGRLEHGMAWLKGNLNPALKKLLALAHEPQPRGRA